MSKGQQLTGQAFDFKSLIESSRLFLSSDDMEFISGSLLLAVMGKFMVSRAMIIIYKEEREQYEVFHVKGSSSFSKGDFISIQDVDSNSDNHLTSTTNKDLPTGFFRLVPLKTASAHIGFLCIGEKFDKTDFNAPDIEFMDALSALAAISISKALLFERIKRANRTLDRKIYELNTLFDLSKQFNELDEVGQIADILKFTLMGHLFVRRLFIAYRTTEVDMEPRLLTENNLQVQPTAGELNYLFEQSTGGDIQAVSNIETPPVFLSEGHFQKLFYLKFQNETLAVIGLGNKANGSVFEVAEEQFILSMSNLALLSIQKVSLLQQKIEKEKIEEELNLAKSIQKGLLPYSMPDWEGYEVFGLNKSSKQVGGDYFEVRQAQDGSWVIAIADVTGKGFPAALLMSNLQAALHTLMQSNIELTDATSKLNDTIYSNTPSDKFITFFWGKFDPAKGTFEYVNAGHNPPMLYSALDKSIKELDEGGLLLGAMPSMMPYTSGVVNLQKNDMIVMFTDGVTEVFDENNEEFGEERLEAFIKKEASLGAVNFTNKMIDHVMSFAQGIQYDDITTVVLKATTEKS